MDIDPSSAQPQVVMTDMLARAVIALDKQGYAAKLRESGQEALLLGDVRAAFGWAQHLTNRVWVASSTTKYYDAPDSSYRLIDPVLAPPAVKIYGSDTALERDTDYKLLHVTNPLAYDAMLRIVGGKPALWTVGYDDDLVINAIAVSGPFVAEPFVPDEALEAIEAHAVRDWRRREFQHSGYGGSAEEGESDVPLTDADLELRLLRYYVAPVSQITRVGMD